jgi:YHS domain-containing protein
MLLALLFACATKPEVGAPPEAKTAMAAPQDAAPQEEACDHEHGAEHIVAASVLPEFKDQNGRLACPVMGDIVDSPAEATSHADYQGVRYYFCCDSCEKRFAADPEAFADGRFLRQEGIWPGGTSDQG